MQSNELSARLLQIERMQSGSGPNETEGRVIAQIMTNLLLTTEDRAVLLRAIQAMNRRQSVRDELARRCRTATDSVAASNVALTEAITRGIITEMEAYLTIMDGPSTSEWNQWIINQLTRAYDFCSGNRTTRGLLSVMIFGVLLYASSVDRSVFCTSANFDGPVWKTLDNTALRIPEVFEWVRGNLWGIINTLFTVQSFAGLLVDKTDDKKKVHKDDQ